MLIYWGTAAFKAEDRSEVGVGLLPAGTGSIAGNPDAPIPLDPFTLSGRNSSPTCSGDDASRFKDFYDLSDLLNRSFCLQKCGAKPKNRPILKAFSDNFGHLAWSDPDLENHQQHLRFGPCSSGTAARGGRALGLGPSRPSCSPVTSLWDEFDERAQSSVHRFRVREVFPYVGR